MGKPVNKTLRIAAMSAGEEIGHVSGPIVTFRGNGTPLRSLLVNIEPAQAGTGDPSPDNVRPISGWSAVNVWAKPTYDPTANPTATIQLGQTIYGATLDATNGMLTVDRGYDQMTYSYLSSLTENYIGYVVVTNKGPAIWVRNWKYTEIAPRREGGVFGICNAFPVRIHDYGIFASQYRIYFFVDSNITGVSDFLDVVQTLEANGSGLYICYELATPITIPLTPTEISTLQGQNNVWADSGDVDVEYIATGGEGGKLALLLRNRKELLIALRKGLSPAEVGLLGSIPSFGGFVRPGISTNDEKEEDELL